MLSGGESGQNHRGYEVRATQAPTDIFQLSTKVRLGKYLVKKPKVFRLLRSNSRYAIILSELYAKKSLIKPFVSTHRNIRVTAIHHNISIIYRTLARAYHSLYDPLSAQS